MGRTFRKRGKTPSKKYSKYPNETRKQVGGVGTKRGLSTRSQQQVQGEIEEQVHAKRAHLAAVEEEERQLGAVSRGAAGTKRVLSGAQDLNAKRARAVGWPPPHSPRTRAQRQQQRPAAAEREAAAAAASAAAEREAAAAAAEREAAAAAAAAAARAAAEGEAAAAAAAAAAEREAAAAVGVAAEGGAGVSEGGPLGEGGEEREGSAGVGVPPPEAVPGAVPRGAGVAEGAEGGGDMAKDADVEAVAAAAEADEAYKNYLEENLNRYSLKKPKSKTEKLLRINDNANKRDGLLTEFLSEKNKLQKVPTLSAYEILIEGETKENIFYWDVVYFTLLLFVMDGVAHDKIYGDTQPQPLMKAVLINYPNMPLEKKILLKQLVGSTSDAKAKAVLRVAVIELLTKIGFDITSENQKTFQLDDTGCTNAAAHMRLTKGKYLALLIDSLKGDYELLFKKIGKSNLAYLLSPLTLADPYTKKPSLNDAKKEGISLLIDNNVYKLPLALGLPGAITTTISRDATDNADNGKKIVVVIAIEEGKEITVKYNYRCVSIASIQALCQVIKERKLDYINEYTHNHEDNDNDNVQKNTMSIKLNKGNFGEISKELLLVSLCGLKTIGDKFVGLQGLEKLVELIHPTGGGGGGGGGARRDEKRNYLILNNKNNYRDRSTLESSGVEYAVVTLDLIAALQGYLTGNIVVQFNGPSVTISKGNKTNPTDLRKEDITSIFSKHAVIIDTLYKMSAHDAPAAAAPAAPASPASPAAVAIGAAYAAATAAADAVADAHRGAAHRGAAPAVNVPNTSGLDNMMKRFNNAKENIPHDLSLSEVTGLPKNFYDNNQTIREELIKRGDIIRRKYEYPQEQLEELQELDKKLDLLFASANYYVKGGRVKPTKKGYAVLFATMAYHVNPIIQCIFGNVSGNEPFHILLNILYTILRRYTRFMIREELTYNIASDIYANPVDFLTPHSNFMLQKIYTNTNTFMENIAKIDVNKLISDKSMIDNIINQIYSNTHLNLNNPDHRQTIYNGIVRIFYSLDFNEYASNEAALRVMVIFSLGMWKRKKYRIRGKNAPSEDTSANTALSPVMSLYVTGRNTAIVQNGSPLEAMGAAGVPPAAMGSAGGGGGGGGGSSPAAASLGAAGGGGPRTPGGGGSGGGVEDDEEDDNDGTYVTENEEEEGEDDDDDDGDDDDEEEEENNNTYTTKYKNIESTFINILNEFIDTENPLPDLYRIIVAILLDNVRSKKYPENMPGMGHKLFPSAALGGVASAALGGGAANQNSELPELNLTNFEYCGEIEEQEEAERAQKEAERAQRLVVAGIRRKTKKYRRYEGKTRRNRRV